MIDVPRLLRLVTEPLLLPEAIVTVEQKGPRSWCARGTQPEIACVVKLYRAESSGFMREVKALKILGKRGSAPRVPRILRYGVLSGTAMTFLVMTELKGETLDEAVGRRCFRKEALLAIGRLLAELHRLPCQVGSFGKRNPIQMISETCEEQARVLADRREHEVADLVRVTRRHLERQDWVQSRLVFCHGDLHLQNVVVNVGLDGCLRISGVVDFEAARIAWPEFDLAKSIVVSTLEGNMSEEESILTGYGCAEINREALLGLKVYHALDGWVYGKLLEQRDCKLWDDRLRRFTREFRARLKT